jgi:hypothetical protein
MKMFGIDFEHHFIKILAKNSDALVARVNTFIKMHTIKRVFKIRNLDQIFCNGDYSVRGVNYNIICVLQKTTAFWYKSVHSRSQDIIKERAEYRSLWKTFECGESYEFRITMEIGSTFFWLLVSYRAAEKVKYEFLSSV